MVTFFKNVEKGLCNNSKLLHHLFQNMTKMAGPGLAGPGLAGPGLAGPGFDGLGLAGPG
jgi:hypothetical protein